MGSKIAAVCRYLAAHSVVRYFVEATRREL
jgi:hypothetical protein